MIGTATFPLGPYEAVLLGTAVVMLLVLFYIIYRALHPRRPKRAARRHYNAELFKRRMALEELGYEMLNDVRVKGGNGRMVAVDHVMRLPASILMIVSAPAGASGRVKASPMAGEWRYLAPDRTLATMLNPLVQLHPLITAIRNHFPLVRVRVLTVFPNSTDFGGAVPRLCCRSETLIEEIRAFTRDDGTPCTSLEAAWPTLSRALRQGGPANKTGSTPGTRAARAVS